MSLLNILILIGAAILIRLAFPGALRRWALLVASVVAIYWLQPALPIRQADFWFPTATLALIFLSWGITSEKSQLHQRETWLAAGLALGTVLLIALTRFISLEGVLTPSRPPQFTLIAAVVALILLLAFLLARFVPAKALPLNIGLMILLILFLILKNPWLSTLVSRGLRQWMGQDPALAQASDLGWLGFSYVAFRLIHTLIDRINGRLKDIQLDEYLIYTLFYPAFVAGPLDRLQRFRKDLYQPTPIAGEDWLQSGQRLAAGLFRKFIIADSLALIALNVTNASQVASSGWLWLLLFAYSFQLFFDFAGYTDIAIGAGRLLGFQLPENFQQPYRKPNLTLFWNNWHMTLTQWFRGYFFNPLTRMLRRDYKLPAPLIIFLTQMSTMMVIGLWHGVTRNFLIWGIWHGLGLYLHNRWSSFAAPRTARWVEKQPWLGNLFNISGAALTFFFVSLGWVWFALPSTELALQTFGRLFGWGA